jgi:catechol 2,3-dioxygenase-like lactoylglutathione lyase family enzyme
MGFHHVSLATKDFEATHRFYTDLMGFELVKVQNAPTPEGTGWSRLAFYDTGGDGLMSFWDLHDDSVGADYRTDLGTSLGLPTWVNHLAFDAPTLDDIEARKQCWREHGITVIEIDWGNTTSIYTADPNGILVEFACTIGSFFTAQERTKAHANLVAQRPELDPRPAVKLHPPIEASAK